MFPAQISGLVICAGGVIRNLMVAAVSAKPSMQSIPQKRTFYPYTTAAKSAQTYLSGGLLPIKGKRLHCGYWAPKWLIFSWLR